MVFEEKEFAKLQANFSDNSSSITIDGVTAAVITPENAKAQVDKILGIVGKSVSTTKMKQIITKEAVAE